MASLTRSVLRAARPSTRSHTALSLGRWVLLCLVMLGMVLYSGNRAAQAAPTSGVAVTPGGGLPGAFVTISGTGFPKRTAVTLVWDGSTAGMPTGTTSPNGSFQLQLAIPSVAAGTHRVGATAARTGASATVQVLAPSASLAVTASTATVPPPTATQVASATQSATVQPTSTPVPATATATATSTPVAPTPTAVATGNPTQTATAVSPPSITIQNPLSNHTYAGTITAAAVASNAASVSYQVDSGAYVAMVYDAGSGWWQAGLDTTTTSNGYHNVTVYAQGFDGSIAQDRAWNILVANAAMAPTATVAALTALAATPSPVTSSAKVFGVNDAAAEFGEQHLPGTLGVDYVYPSDASRSAYLAGKGLTLVRLPFLWERVQPTALGPLSAADVSGIRSALDTAQAAGQQVILDLHNYGRYYGAPLTRADAGKLADVWGKLAQAFRGHPALYGYELMNEPHDLPEGADAWAFLAQAAADGVRQYDTSAWLLVPGYSWQSARFWADNNASLNVSDPSRRVVYAAHLYFDASYNGTYGASYDADGAYPTIGVERLQPFLAWLASRNAQGMLTEYGVPDNDARWNTVLDNFLGALAASGSIRGGTYWAAGPWWGTYPLSVEPRGGADRPQMAVLARYPSHG